MEKQPQKSSLTKLTGQGVLWQVGGGFIFTLLRLGSSACLARLLDPRDFGILGMGIIAVNAMTYIGNIGIGTAVVAKKEVNKNDLSTGFWIILANRIILFLMAFLCAPLLADFFREPRVTWVFRVASVVFLFSAFEAIPNSILVKELKYKSLFFINVLRVIIESSLAIVLAYKTELRYWALIIAMLSSYFSGLILLWLLVDWRPKLCFSKKSFLFYKSYLINSFGNSIVLYFRQNIDYILVGRVLGSTSLGLYEYAYKIPHMFIDRFIFPISNVLLPAFSKIQEDKTLVADSFLKAFRIICFFSFPSLLFLAATSDLVVPILWGNKWMSITTPLKILCVAALLQAILRPSMQIFWVYRRPDLVFKNNMTQLIFTMIFVYLGSHLYGINGVALGMLIGSIPNMFFFFIALNIINFDFKKLFTFLILLILISSISAYVVYIFNMYSIFSNRINLLLSSLTIGLIIFILLSFITLKSLYRDLLNISKSIFV